MPGKLLQIIQEPIWAAEEWAPVTTINFVIKFLVGLKSFISQFSGKITQVLLKVLVMTIRFISIFLKSWRSYHQLWSQVEQHVPSTVKPGRTAVPSTVKSGRTAVPSAVKLGRTAGAAIINYGVR